MILLCVMVVFVGILPNSLAEGKCNSTLLTAKNGTVDYPKPVEKGETCTFKIKVKDKTPNFITLLLSSVILSSGGKLQVYDGDAKTENQLFTISGSSGPEQVVVTFSNNVSLEYTVGAATPSSNWTISYTSDECATEVANTWAVKMETPRYLPTKKRGFKCQYTVTSSLPADRIPVASMQLTLTNGSYLDLVNGQSKKHFTEEDSAQDFYPSNDSAPIEVTFNVADASTKPKFSVVVDPLVQDCSTRLEINSTYSLNLTIPADHPVQYSCRWLIMAKPTTVRILAKVTSLSLVDDIDFLTFTDGSSSASTDQTLVSLSSNPTPGYLVVTTADSLIVSLNLGNSDVERRVEIDFSPQEDGGRFVGQGRLQAGSPKTDADADISAYFQLVASPGKVVNIQVLTSLPENATLSFYDGLQTTNKLLTVFSSKTDGLDSLIGNSEMLLVLDSFPSTGNFTASFTSAESGCDKTLTDASGQLSFSNLASFNGTQNCTLTIAPYNTPTGTIVLNFDSLTIGDDESVLIFSGSGNTLVAQLNKDLGQASEVFLSGATVARILVMNGGHKKTRTSLTGRYSVMADACGGKLSAGKGDILTPNFPNQYPLNAQCSWPVSSAVDVTTDEAATTNALYLNFKSLNLVPGHCIDVSDLNNGSAEELAHFEGNELPDDFIVLVTPGVNVMFRASPKDAAMKNEVGTGADISYMVVSCGGNMSTENGTFTSPGYPKTPTQSSTCVWIIHVADTPAGEHETNIVTFNLTLKNKAATVMPDYLSVFDGASVRSPVMSSKVTKGLTGRVLSRYNKVVIQYSYELDPKTKDKAGFTLTYSTYNCNSSQLCDNGVCLHPDWRCNGVDDCKDFTDERGCLPTPIPIVTTPKPSSGGSSTSGYVKGGYVALLFFIALILGAVLVIVVPKIVRHFRGGGGGSYSRMQDSAPVVT